MTNILTQLTVSNTTTTPKIEIGDYVISKTIPNKGKCGKLTGRTNNYFIVTPDDPNKNMFRKVPHILAKISRNNPA